MVAIAPLLFARTPPPESLALMLGKRELAQQQKIAVAPTHAFAGPTAVHMDLSAVIV